MLLLPQPCAAVGAVTQLCSREPFCVKHQFTEPPLTQEKGLRVLQQHARASAPRRTLALPAEQAGSRAAAKHHNPL